MLATAPAVKPAGGLVSPTSEHGKLRYSPRDRAIAALIRRLLEAWAGVEGIRMLRRLAERDVRRAAASGDQAALAEEALRILYQRSPGATSDPRRRAVHRRDVAAR